MTQKRTSNSLDVRFSTFGIFITYFYETINNAYTSCIKISFLGEAEKRLSNYLFDAKPKKDSVTIMNLVFG